MKKLIILLLLLTGISVYPQQFPDYYQQNRFGLTSPGAMKYGLYGYVNPAILATMDQPDLLLTWSTLKGEDWNAFNNWGIFAAVPNFGFAAVTQKMNGAVVTDYKLSTAMGNEAYSFGLGLGWSSGHQDYFERNTLWTAGLLLRPINYLSVGLIANWTSAKDEYVIDAGIRPLGNELITLFGDYVYTEDQPDAANIWSAGVALEPYDGIRFTGRYFENEIFNVGVELSFGRTGIFSKSDFNEDGEYASNVFGIRVGAYDRNTIPKIFKKEQYAEIDLNGPVKYQRFKWFDNSNTLMDLLEQIDAAAKDETVSGIAINLSGMEINREMIWEIREKMLEFRAAGKKIYVYFDRLNIDGYYLASAADKIIMDPAGMVTLEGMLMGRQYYKQTLEKLGVGFTEWRYFKYKSAAETFSRDKMSEADREQRQALVDDFYALEKDGITSGRNITRTSFDDIVNNQVFLIYDDAKKAGLVDEAGRWENVKELVKKETGNDHFLHPGMLEKFQLPDDNYWGQKPQIAVIYALGACAMDEGITARKLVKDVQWAVENKNVKGIVLRVDSPGGDGLASDIIAEALRKAEGKKPVIISQGYVAASGGYWLSMYGDTIVAAPNTITGSIGVIGGWAYNKELKDKLGVTTDYVKQGDHADLGFGFTVPLIGMTLPDRDLTKEEQARAEELIKKMYNEFVGKVADGRGRQFDDIQEIAQGRVWSGVDGKSNGLVDVLGGLDHAIKITIDKAGLTGKEYDVIELPEPKWFSFDSFMPKLFGFDYKEDLTFKTFKLRLQHNGEPMPMLPLEDALDWEMKMGRQK